MHTTSEWHHSCVHELLLLSNSKIAVECTPISGSLLPAVPSLSAWCDVGHPFGEGTHMKFPHLHCSCTTLGTCIHAQSRNVDTYI